MRARWISASALTIVLAACGGGAQTSAPVASAKPAAPVEDTPRVVEITPDMGSPHVGDPAPDFELPDQDGKPTKLSSMKGSVVVLAFVTSWCPFSKAEHPNLKTFAEAYSPKGVKFVAVDIAEPEADYRTYVNRVALPFPVLKDEKGTVAKSYAPPKALPMLEDRTRVVVTSTLVLDAQGTIRFFGLTDTAHFDAEFVNAKRAVDAVLKGGT